MWECRRSFLWGWSHHPIPIFVNIPYGVYAWVWFVITWNVRIFEQEETARFRSFWDRLLKKFRVGIPDISTYSCGDYYTHHGGNSTDVFKSHWASLYLKLIFYVFYRIRQNSFNFLRFLQISAKFLLDARRLEELFHTLRNDFIYIQLRGTIRGNVNVLWDIKMKGSSSLLTSIPSITFT